VFILKSSLVRLLINTGVTVNNAASSWRLLALIVLGSLLAFSLC
jgi:Na+-transporting NADH:ubiquinone oxidoreductase subunit NqrB